jgi:hypothetical protein
MFGTNRFATTPVVSFRWDYEKLWVRWKRLTAGGTWECIHFRETEWKGGGRLGIRLLPRVSAVLYVFGPGKAEWRGGVLEHPLQKEQAASAR